MPKIVNKDEKRSEILKAALGLFASLGLSSTRMSDIALSAGIGKGTIYEYFSSKKEIINASFYYFLEVINSKIARKIYLTRDPLEKLISYLDAWNELLDETSLSFFSVFVEYWAEGLREQSMDSDFDLNEMYRDYRTLLQHLLDDCIVAGKIRHVNTHLTASIIIGSLDGVMMQWILDPKMIDIRSALQTLKEIILKGISK